MAQAGGRSVNSVLNHTVGQPVCESFLAEKLTADWTGYFEDVFFPMAHSVHESAATVACSRWVIEYALLTAFTQIYNDVAADEVTAQAATTEVWRGRCEARLQQIGTCLLRGVFDIYLPSAEAPDPKCQFGEIMLTGCEGIAYFTPNCLLGCAGAFYDPCSVL